MVYLVPLNSADLGQGSGVTCEAGGDACSGAGHGADGACATWVPGTPGAGATIGATGAGGSGGFTAQSAAGFCWGGWVACWEEAHAKCDARASATTTFHTKLENLMRE